jgi:uncharacterized protein (TIGR03435 family)
MASTLRSLALFSLMIGSAFSQSPDPRPSFEVATVRMYPSGSPFRPESQGLTRSPDGFRATHVTLRGCLQGAYGIVDVSGPSWIIEESYDIEAKADRPVSAAEFSLMFQRLLEERFRLKLHRETKISPIGVLVVGKNGTKNLPTIEGTGPMEIKRANGKLFLTNAPMSRVAGVLGSPLGNMPLENVIDETGLTGLYDLTLDLRDFDPKDREFRSYTEMRDALLFFVSRALEKQYGLRLERRNVPIETLVIDSGNKVPMEN